MACARLRERLSAGQQAFGCWTSSPDPALIDLIAQAGFDYVNIDMEHAPNTLESVQGLLYAAQANGISALVRPPDMLPSSLQRVVDLGPDGVYLPHAASAAEVAEAIAAMKFAPAGTRSASLGSRAARLGRATVDVERYKTETNRHLITWVQIEDAEAVREIEAIASVPGVDICGIAPLDLSRSLGCRAHVDDPVLQAAVAKVAAALRAHPNVHLAIPAVVFGAQRAIELGATVVNVAEVYQAAGRALKSALADVRPDGS